MYSLWLTNSISNKEKVCGESHLAVNCETIIGDSKGWERSHTQCHKYFYLFISFFSIHHHYCRLSNLSCQMMEYKVRAIIITKFPLSLLTFPTKSKQSVRITCRLCWQCNASMWADYGDGVQYCWFVIPWKEKKVKNIN